MKHYGTLNLDTTKNTWVLDDLQPHVIIKLKSIFKKIKKTASNPFYFENTLENCVELEWFTSRYPLEITPEDLKSLHTGKFDYLQNMNDLEQILKPDYQGKDYGLKLPLRDYQAQVVEVFFKKKRLLIGDDVGLGKAQPVDAKVLTPIGFIPIGNISVGDVVFNEKGLPSLVEGVYPQGVKDVYKITFCDGSWAESCEEHLWSVQTDNDVVRNGKFRTLQLSEIRKIYKNEKGRLNLRIPVTDPIKFSARAPFDPYLFGVVLGDGCVRHNNISISNEDIEEVVSNIKLIDGHFFRKIPSSERCSAVRLLSAKKYFNHYRFWLNILGVMDKFSYEKSIPDCFKYVSVPDRINLLQGLMDTDGSVYKDGTVQYFTTSKKLSEDFSELVQSLGGNSRISEKNPKYKDKFGKSKEGKLCYVHTVRLPSEIIPFKLQRKVERLRESTKYPPTRKIVDIRKSRSSECVCIKVSSASQLYITDNYVVTHNTLCGIATATKKECLPVIVVVQTHLPTQWKEQIEKFTDCKIHTIKGTTPYTLPEADFYILKYSCLAGWGSTLAQLKMANCIVFDEIQELRIRGSQKYSGAKKLISSVEYVLGLSATPIFNFGEEIYNVLDLINPDCLGNEYEFMREWTAYSRVVQNPKALGTYLRDNFLMIRRTREDVKKELPPINKIVHTVDFDEKAVKDIEDLARLLAVKVTTGAPLERGQAARELDMMVRHATGVSKAKYVADYVKIMLENKEPVLLAGWHRDVYDIWLKELAAYNPVMYTGSESPAQKEAAKKSFINGETDLMIISLRSGIGLDGLQTRCSIVTFGELDWSPAVHHQVTGRLARDGQEDQVTAIYLVSDSGSDPLIVNLLGLKASQSQDILNPLAGVSEQFSDESRITQLAQNILNKIGTEAK